MNSDARTICEDLAAMEKGHKFMVETTAYTEPPYATEAW